MSAFHFPENVNEPTHSTQFSFDESLIFPNFISSPSLTNHGSNTSAKSNFSTHDDVVEAIANMQQGCFMIVMKLPVNDKGEMLKNNNNVPIEWNITSLSDDNKSINNYSNKIPIADIEKVSKLHQASAARVQRTLNIPGVEQIGLQSVTLRLTMKEEKKEEDQIEEQIKGNLITANYNYFLIFDEYQTAFIWNRGLRTIIHMNKIKQPITTIAFCVSPVDRINNEEMQEKMTISDDDEIYKWINHIATKLPSVQKHIQRCHRFAQTCCILDSSEHLSLLLSAKGLMEMYVDTKKLIQIPFYQLAKSEIRSLREVWMSLLADLSVAMLKEHQLRNDMKASVSSINQYSISMISK